jgi:hypothetical protein
MEPHADPFTEPLAFRELTFLRPERSVLAELWEEFSDLDFPCVLADLRIDGQHAQEACP